VSKVGIIALVLVEVFLQSFFRLVDFGIANRGVSFGLVPGLPVVILLIAMMVFVIQTRAGRASLWWSLVFIGGVANLTSRIIGGGQVWDYARLYPGSGRYSGFFRICRMDLKIEFLLLKKFLQPVPESVMVIDDQYLFFHG